MSAIVESAAEQVAFGPFVYDRGNRLLWRDDIQVPLPPRAVGVLGLLLERPGQLISKQDLISGVWPDAFVTETSLAEAISFVRQALADDSQNPTYIQTLHRRGYRFIADIRPVNQFSKGVGGHEGSAAARESAREPHPRAAASFRNASEPRLSLLAPWLVAFFAVAVASVALWKFTQAAAPAFRAPVRFEIALPAGLSISSGGSPVAVSHDGRAIAFSACRTPESGCAIFLRPLSQPEATEIAGTAGGQAPFFSPDGRWLGYFAAGQLQKIALAGGSPIPLAPAAHAFGAAWTTDDRVVFAGSGAGLSIVPANGGAARLFTRPSEGTEHRWPTALPSSDGVIFTVASASSGHERTYAGIASLESGAWGRLMDDVSTVRAPLDGYLVASRGDNLIGVTFDTRSRSVSGTAASVAPRATYDSQGPRFAAAPVGTLVVAPPGSSVLNVILDWGEELRRLVPPSQPPLPR